MDRRDFLETALYVGATSLGSPLLLDAASRSIWSDFDSASSARIWGHIAATSATSFRPYFSAPAQSADATTWVQVDLGAIYAIDTVRIYPASGRDGWPYPYCFDTFPIRFKIESSEDKEFNRPAMIADCTSADFPDPKDAIIEFPAFGKRSRFIRLTVTRMRAVHNSADYRFAVSKLEVLRQGRDLAVDQTVTGDEEFGSKDDLAQITRKPRPAGEGLITDHVENVTSPVSWKPIKYKASVPLAGVTLDGGLFESALEQNIGYLLDSFTVDELLRQFRARAGRPNPLGMRTPDKFWEEDLAGSNAGRFLMGAANTLRWMQHPELRRRLDAVIDGIDECKQPNGYIMAYPEDSIFYSERGAYTRAWVTHGLIEAAYTGNSKAFGLLRGYYNWFDSCKYLPELLRRVGLGPQGMIANTRIYFTPIGMAQDIQVVQRYFQEDYWLESLAHRREESIWQYPYDRPHCYELTFLEAYLDLYRATGARRYLDAVSGGWDLYHAQWENVGGSMSMEEFQKDPPGSHWLDRQHGELCGSVFWVFLNQRFHCMYPEEEKYVTEIEKSIYNVGLANQDRSNGFRYFTTLVGQKEKSTRQNTCCEAQGARLIGSLPEHIYSLAVDGLYVNLFEPSSLSWRQGRTGVLIKMSTSFPLQNDVKLEISVTAPTRAKIRIRVPSWSSNEMLIAINAQNAGAGTPGSYFIVDRTWNNGDRITFSLPVALALRKYIGADAKPGQTRYALEYGPILMAAVGSSDVSFRLTDSFGPAEFFRQLISRPGNSLRFDIAGHPGVTFIPYWEVRDERFTCFPIYKSESS